MRETFWSAVRTVEPADTPITLAQAKAQCTVDADITVDDALLEGFVFAAADVVENMTTRALLPQTWVRSADGFPCDGEPIVLPRPPLRSVTSVQYRDSNGVLQTWNASNYDLVVDDTFGSIVPKVGICYPTTACRPDAVKVTFIAGYDTAEDIPARFMVAQQMLVAHWYANRGIVGAEGLGLTHLVGAPAHPDPCW